MFLSIKLVLNTIQNVLRFEIYEIHTDNCGICYRYYIARIKNNLTTIYYKLNKKPIRFTHLNFSISLYSVM